MRAPLASAGLLALLALSAGSAPSGAGAQEGAARDTVGRRAALAGVVRDSAGTPLEGAVVTVEAVGRTVLSDAEGKFVLGGLPSDTVEVSVRRVGYAPAYFAAAIPPGMTVSVAVKMLPNAVTLGKVVVEGKARDLTLNRHGFYDREKFGHGVFLDAEFMAPRRGLRATTLMREVPRARVACPGNGMRGCVLLVGGCSPALFVDGTLIENVGTDFDAIVDTRYVVGMEVYRSLLEAPPQYQRPWTNCGSVVVWTEFAPPALRKRARPAADPDAAAART